MDTGFFGVSRPRRALGLLSRAALRLVATFCVSVLLASGLTSPAGTTATLEPSALGPSTALTSPVSAFTLGEYERRVQRLVNRRRANHDLRRLRLADCPETTSKRWSRHLAEENEFYHQSMSSVLERCDAVYAGETLGRGTMRPRKLVRMWMQSPGHRAVLLSGKSRRIGVGASVMSDGRWVVTANFIRF